MDLYTDACGNASTRQATLTIDITAPPTLSGAPNSVILECDEVIPPPAIVTAMDACGNAINVIFDEEEINGIITRTWTAIDDCGNSETETQIIVTGNDTEAPTLIGVPADANTFCEDIQAPPTVTATDNCDEVNEITLEFEEEITQTACGETIVRTWTATDAIGNSVSDSQTIINTEDQVPPTITGIPADLTLTCNDDIPAPANAMATDDCSDVVLTFEETQDGTVCEDGITITRTWTATDGCNNVTIETQIITIFDEDTEITPDPPTDFDLECDEDVPAAEQPTTTTTCPDGELFYELMEEEIPGDCPNSYTLIRTWTITDNCGNSETVTQTISVSDTTAPIFTFVPGHEDLTCDGYPDGFGEPEIEDNCGDFTMEIIDTFNPYICDAEL